jgi:hypothetical protein
MYKSFAPNDLAQLEFKTSQLDSESNVLLNMECEGSPGDLLRHRQSPRGSFFGSILNSMKKTNQNVI